MDEPFVHGVCFWFGNFFSLSTLILGALLWLGLAAFSGSGGSNGSRGNIIIEDYDGTYEAYEHGFGIYKDVTGSGKTWRKEDSQYIRIN